MSKQCACGHERLGYALSHGVLSKTVEGSLHMLRQPKGWAVQVEVIEHHRGEIKQILVNDAEKGICYSMGIEHFDKVKFQIDRGYGAQYVVALDYWQRSNSYVKQLGLPL